jgi:hypothetical protein
MARSLRQGLGVLLACAALLAALGGSPASAAAEAPPGFVELSDDSYPRAIMAEPAGGVWFAITGGLEGAELGRIDAEGKLMTLRAFGPPGGRSGISPAERTAGSGSPGPRPTLSVR